MIRKLDSSDRYQIALIALGVAAIAMFGLFFKREIAPEYKIYQNDFIALEKFRSQYTGEPPSSFQTGVKQILLPRSDNGPAQLDRCVSCHVALQISDYSPTKILYDLNGKMALDEEGNPILVENEKYIWKRLQDKINELSDPQVIEQLRQNGQVGEVNARLKEAQEYEALKKAEVGEASYDVTKVLAMHPLIGKETRPFEFHSIDEYGCVSCHSGNGRGLTTDKAHGPILDGMYEEAETGHKEHFLESDPNNDPPFSRVFNHMPGDKLLFQTTPLLLGSLIEAKCVQCHKSTPKVIEGALFHTNAAVKRIENRFKAVSEAYKNSKAELLTLLELKKEIETKGMQATEEQLKLQAADYSLPVAERQVVQARLTYFRTTLLGKSPSQALTLLSEQIERLVGPSSQQLEKMVLEAKQGDQQIDRFIAENKEQKGALFAQRASLKVEEQRLRQVQEAEAAFHQSAEDPEVRSALISDLDFLTTGYAKGEELYISQACYACHRIAGFARGGVGPELTNAGSTAPWFLKESIVWPQADLPTSTMPNFKLDHDEVEELMTFLLAQNGRNKTESDTTYKVAIQEWEAGKKSALEKPVTPTQMADLEYGMTVFATEGCASCHRLKGFDSTIGFAVEAEGKASGKASFDAIDEARGWFARLFPEEALGSQIVASLEANQEVIDQRIVTDAHQRGVLDQIDQLYPGMLESFYSNFKYASRAKNHEFAEKIAKEPAKRLEFEKELEQWQERVKRVLFVYIQEYGLGRLIGPRPNWSGVYRSDQWLMEHFRNPISHVPGSLMPIFPFDDTKFYALTKMLDTLSIRNRDAVREIWNHKGFDPALAANIYCAQCHGEFLQGNGPVAQWTYPIPKNLRNADFLRNLTKENAVDSIIHGIPGTPMPPWGEVATDKPTADGVPVLNAEEIGAIVDWLFSEVPGGSVIRQSDEVPKWQYQPKDVIEELKEENSTLKGSETEKEALSALLPTGAGYYAAMTPTVYRDDKEVWQFFDVIQDPKDAEKKEYFIRKKFYTTENIEKGRSFFLTNCAVCHGSEADGSGTRAEIMQDAKPRMLINIDWQRAYDDLYLLRSIKYGVPGTSMTPWGDLTSSLQRIQLVIYLRSIVAEQRRRELLLSTLYEAFEAPQLLIQTAREKEYSELEESQKEYRSLERSYREKPQELDGDLAAKLYQQLLKLSIEISNKKKRDQLFLSLKEQVKRELELYRELGLDLLAQKIDDALFQDYVASIASYKSRYRLEAEQLTFHQTTEMETKVNEIKESLIALIDKEIVGLKEAVSRAEGRIASKERNEEIAHLSERIKGLNHLKQLVITNLSAAERSNQEQKELIEQLLKINT